MSGHPRTTGADLVLCGGRIHGNAPDAGALPEAGSPIDSLVISGGRVDAVTDRRTALGHAGPHTHVVELQGRTCLPGFVDAHVHPLAGGLQAVGCDLRRADDESAVLAAVGRYAAAHPELPWVIARGWHSTLVPPTTPTALDAVTGGRPTCLIAADVDGVWVNTAALRAAGLGGRTPGDGASAGWLGGDDAVQVNAALPDIAPGTVEEALLTAQTYLHSRGITSWQDAQDGARSGDPDPSPAYVALADSGDLTVGVSLMLRWDHERGQDQAGELIRRRQDVQRAGLRADRVKLVDGLLDPGALHVAVARLTDAGFSAHFRAADRAGVRRCLEAVEQLGRGPVASAGRHQIAHEVDLDAATVDRLAAAGVTSVLTGATSRPALAASGAATCPAPGPGSAALATLLGSDVELALGTDWPAGDAEPLHALRAAGADPVAGRRILHALTAGSARAAGLPGRGRLDRGRRADVVVLDAATDEPLSALADARIDLTVVAGRVVHTRQGATL